MYLKLIRCIASLLLLLVGWQTDALSQNGDRYVTVRGVIEGKDTVPHVTLSEVRIFKPHSFRSRRQQVKWTRFVYNVKKALPYARLVAKEVNIIQDSLARIPTPEARAAYMDAKEEELMKKYANQLKHLTITQGRILIKLVDRETGQTSYNLIKMLKGDAKAFWWQGIACLFGSSLKSEYDSVGKDSDIENVVLLIDMGVY